MTNRHAALVVLVLLAGAACASDPPCGLRACDIRNADCQRLIEEAAACLRGVTPVMVPVVLVSREEYVQSAATTTLSPEQQESFRRWNAGFAALGMAPATASPAETYAASASQVGAFYSGADRQITVIDDGWALDGWPYVALMVHEYTHAIQDARFDLAQLGARYATDSDRSLALGAVTEGEATYVGDLATIGFFGLAPGDVPWDRVLGNWQASSRSEARRSPFPVSLSWLQFRYPFGTAYVKGAVDAEGWTGVDGLYGSPPGGTRQVMAAFGADEPDQGPWVEELGDDAIPVLDTPFAYVGADRVGAWLLEVFMLRLGEQLRYHARDLPAQLRGDTLSIFRDQDTDGTVAVWHLRLATDPARFALETALEGLPTSTIRVQGSGDRDLMVIAASDAATLAAVPTALTFRAVPAATPPGAAAAATAALARRFANGGCVQPTP